MSARKVVVTGATGHLGRSVVALCARSAEVVAASRSGALPEPPYGEREPPSSNVRGLALDIESETAVAILERELGPGVALVHLAAWHPPRTAGTTPDERARLVEVNVLGTMRVLEAARRRASTAGVASVVYASSFEVYGLPTHAGAVVETDRVNPVTDYGATKLSGEDHLLAFAYEEKVRAVALRFPAIYGPGELTERALPHFLRLVAEGRRPVIAGNGQGLHDQVHVRDAARAIRLALESSACGIFNLADGEPHSILELAREAMRMAGVAGEPERVPEQEAHSGFHMSIDAARRVLGFEPSVTLADGMREQLTWLRRSLT